MKKFIRICLIAPYLVSLATGAIAPRSEEELEGGAELIVTGRVTAVEVSTEGSPLNANWVVVLTAELDGVERGDQVATGEAITVHCWQVKRRPKGWAGPSGHGDIPAEGSRFRMWLRSTEDGEWSPLQPNGIELLEGSPRLEFSEVREAGGLAGGSAAGPVGGSASGLRVALIGVVVAAVVVVVLVLGLLLKAKRSFKAKG